jgi:hypothetical protein
VDEQTAGTRRTPGAHPWRRWSNPLTRPSDRVQAVSRVVTLLLLLAAVPLAVVVAVSVHGQMARTAAAERAARSLVAATVLADATPGRPAGSADVGTPYTTGTAAGTALAGWHGPDGGYRQAPVAVPAGSRAGNVVHIWVDRSGQPAAAPTGDGDVAADTIAAVVLTVSAVAGTALLGHLAVGLLLERSRMRRWTRGWAAVEPLWTAGSR